MEEILLFKNLNKLKSVYRTNNVEGRKESSAEHTWSTLMLADFFMTMYKYDLDRTRVYELIMYHDVVEIEAGDTELHPYHENSNKQEIEYEAAKKLKEILPANIKIKFWDYFNEFEQQITIEAKFAKAVDAIDPIIQGISVRTEWEGWSKEFLLKKKLPYFKPFPEIEEFFYELLKYLEDNQYFNN